MNTSRNPTHCLKTEPEYFQAVVNGVKRYEARKDDRDFQVGDALHLLEWDAEYEEYTGYGMWQIIIHKLDGGHFGIKEGYCVLGIQKLTDCYKVNYELL